MTQAAVDEYSEGRELRPRPSDPIDLGGADAQVGLVHPFPLSTIVALTSLAFEVSTVGGGGARQVVVQLTDGLGGVAFAIGAPGTQAGGLTVVYSFAPLVTVFGSSGLGFMGGPLPHGRLPYNMSLSIFVVSAAAGDVITNGRLLVEQWPTR